MEEPMPSNLNSSNSENQNEFESNNAEEDPVKKEASTTTTPSPRNKKKYNPPALQSREEVVVFVEGGVVTGMSSSQEEEDAAEESRQVTGQWSLPKGRGILDQLLYPEGSPAPPAVETTTTTTKPSTSAGSTLTTNAVLFRKFTDSWKKQPTPPVAVSVVQNLWKSSSRQVQQPQHQQSSVQKEDQPDSEPSSNNNQHHKEDTTSTTSVTTDSMVSPVAKDETDQDVIPKNNSSGDSGSIDEDGGESYATTGSQVSSTYTDESGLLVQSSSTSIFASKWNSIREAQNIQNANSASTTVSSLLSFRGRYSSSSTSLMNNNFNNNTSTMTTAESNTSATGTNAVPSVAASPSSTTPVITHATRWKASTAADHYNNLIRNLPKHQYIVLLGRGRFGVNLKQCYSKHAGGVYVDFLVERGAAEHSGLVEIGDVIVTVGNVDCRKSNIGAVPTIIANAKRPVAIVLSTSGALETKKINYVDVTVGILQSNCTSTFGPFSKASTTISTASNTTAPKKANSSNQKNDIDDAGEDEDDEMKIVQPTSFDDDERIVLDIPVPPVNLQQQQEEEEPSWLQHPPVHLQQAYANSAAKRNYVPQMMMTSRTRVRSIPDPEDSNLRNALSHAFILVTTDRRRLPFLLKHLSNSPMASAVVSLWTDILNYCEWFELVTDSTRRQWALSILHKYLVPHYGSGEEASGTLQPPTQMDLHHLVSDTTLRELEKAIVVAVTTSSDEVEINSHSSSKPSSSPLTSNIFKPVQSNILSEVAENGGWFTSFITSPDCARMRAYLRNTAPYQHLPLDPFLSIKNHNYWSYVMTYLLCLTTDPEGFGENDDILEISGEKGVRIENAASGMAAALFILQRFSAQPEDLTTWEQLWEFFVAPGGALETGPRSQTVRSYLLELRSTFQQLQKQPQDHDGCFEKTKKMATLLARELIYDYAVNLQPKFRAHKFHEWLCQEIYQKSEDRTGNEWSTILPRGCVKRLLRKASFPVGITPHKHAHFPVDSVSSPSQSIGNTNHVNAECAVVFGSSVGLDLAAQMHIPAMMMMESNCDIRRYTCESVTPRADSDDASQQTLSLTPEEIPATMESYAMATYTHNKKPFFKQYSAGENAACWQSLDGWQVSMINFLVPRAETALSSEDSAEDFSSSLFGVSLLFQRPKSSLSMPECGDDSKVAEFINSENHPNFFRRYSEQRWSDRLNQEVDCNKDAVATIGVALVSQRNVIMSMRNALLMFLQEYSDSLTCGTLVQVLGNFAHQDVESMALKNMLEPFIQRSSAPWLEYPIGYQKECFLQCAGQQLIDSLPPIPLALVFVTVLLEQKIVFTSSRRSLLFSVVATLSELLKPLRWCHLLVPRVPSSLASDLLQYPAPFILGLPSVDPGAMDLIRELPDDVTLVDLDVGRVILATSFAHNSELGRGTPNNAETVRALRAQVLFLAQSLGNVFASTLNPLWNCDNPFATDLSVDVPGAHFTERDSKFDSLRRVCKEFVEELLAGTTSCCYWIEDLGDGDDEGPTILFDEDRFFQIKESRERDGFTPLFFPDRKRSSEFALSLDDFDLALELFLRCQSLNAYIGTRHRNEMMY